MLLMVYFFEDYSIFLIPADIEQRNFKGCVPQTAIMVSRGANGVVYINHKKWCRRKKTVFSYESTFGLRSATIFQIMIRGGMNM